MASLWVLMEFRKRDYFSHEEGILKIDMADMVVIMGYYSIVAMDDLALVILPVHRATVVAAAKMGLNY